MKTIYMEVAVFDYILVLYESQLRSAAGGRGALARMLIMTSFLLSKHD